MKLVITYCVLLFSGFFCYGQKENSFIKGIIKNYDTQPLYLCQCYGDTLLFIDSTHTDKNGEFVLSNLKLNSEDGMYKVILQRNQFFYILYDKRPIEIKTLYQPNAFYNIATDSLVVLKSDENKRFYQFQHLQQRINIANTWLLQMMRLYPLPDPFHKQIEDEYFKRYNAMDELAHPNPPQGRELHAQSSPLPGDKRGTSLVALAYYQPILPDWK